MEIWQIHKNDNKQILYGLVWYGIVWFFVQYLVGCSRKVLDNSQLCNQNIYPPKISKNGFIVRVYLRNDIFSEYLAYFNSQFRKIKW